MAMTTLVTEVDRSTSAQAAEDVVTNYWQIGLTAFNNGDPATVAMQNIWDAMFPADLTLVAKIVGALYGDHYFDSDTMKMSVNLLAQELNAALGKNPPDCQRAASIAFSQWYGLSVRANFQDGALIPRQGNLFNSPDVVINGTTPITPARLIQMWNQTVWGPVSGDRNLLYGRAASVNIQVPITKPVLKMFVVDGSINPPNPQSWTQVFTSDGSRTARLETAGGATTLQPGDRSANADPFRWTVPGSGHYCVISVAGSEFFTNDPALIPPGNWSSAVWITYNGAAGWHNVDTPQGDQAVLKIHNLDGTTERFAIEAHCSELPEGTEVSLETADKKLAMPLRSDVTRIAAREQVVRADAELPGHYSGDVIVRFKTPDGQALPPRATIDVRAYWHVPPGHRHYEDAVELLGDTKAIALSRPVRVFVGNFTLVGEL
jgi:hypothetical protein